MKIKWEKIKIDGFDIPYFIDEFEGKRLKIFDIPRVFQNAEKEHIWKTLARKLLNPKITEQEQAKINFIRNLLLVYQIFFLQPKPLSIAFIFRKRRYFFRTPNGRVYEGELIREKDDYWDIYLGMGRVNNEEFLQKIIPRSAKNIQEEVLWATSLHKQKGTGIEKEIVASIYPELPELLKNRDPIKVAIKNEILDKMVEISVNEINNLIQKIRQGKSLEKSIEETAEEIDKKYKNYKSNFRKNHPEAEDGDFLKCFLWVKYELERYFLWQQNWVGKSFLSLLRYRQTQGLDIQEPEIKLAELCWSQQSFFGNGILLWDCSLYPNLFPEKLQTKFIAPALLKLAFGETTIKGYDIAKTLTRGLENWLVEAKISRSYRKSDARQRKDIKIISLYETSKDEKGEEKLPLYEKIPEPKHKFPEKEMIDLLYNKKLLLKILKNFTKDQIRAFGLKADNPSLTYKEIGQKLNKSPETIRKWFQKVKKVAEKIKAKDDNLPKLKS